MKYVRTNNRIRDVIYDDEIIKINQKQYIMIKCDDIQYKEEIIKQAGTIEELCDGFLVENINDSSIWGVLKTEDFINEYQKHNLSDPKIKNYYGYFKTDKGLIYVAKMNKARDFELL